MNNNPPNIVIDKITKENFKSTIVSIYRHCANYGILIHANREAMEWAAAPNLFTNDTYNDAVANRFDLIIIPAQPAATLVARSTLLHSQLKDLHIVKNALLTAIPVDALPSLI